jgi:fatty acid desaturase
MSQQISSSTLEQRTRLSVRAAIMVAVYTVLFIAAAAVAVAALLIWCSDLLLWLAMSAVFFTLDRIRTNLIAAQEG